MLYEILAAPFEAKFGVIGIRGPGLETCLLKRSISSSCCKFCSFKSLTDALSSMVSDLNFFYVYNNTLFK